MSFKAIDLQVMVQRSNDVSSIKHVQLQQGQNQVHNASVQLKEQSNIQENSVNQLDYLINDTLRDNKNNKQEQAKGKRKKQGSEDTTDTEENLLPKYVGNSFDITI